MRKRMMAAVPKASVVITNPTHYAVALKYERGMNAPVCVAKGVDLHRAARSARWRPSTTSRSSRTRRSRARCTRTVEIDQEIPPEHYQAVAEVIGYVMRLRPGSGRNGGRRSVTPCADSRREALQNRRCAESQRRRRRPDHGRAADRRETHGVRVASGPHPGQQQRRQHRPGAADRRRAGRRGGRPCCWSAAAMPSPISWCCSRCWPRSACSRCSRSPPASCASPGRETASPLIKAVVDGAFDGILVTDARGRVVYANAAYLDLVDAADANDVRPVERVFIGDPDVSEAVYRLLKAAREGRRLQEEVRVGGHRRASRGAGCACGCGRSAPASASSASPSGRSPT